MDEVLEREMKWDVEENFALPRLDDVVAGTAVEHSTVNLNSAYYDTADGDLQSHGVLLRRRDGDDDTGWQLKVPSADGRVEVRTKLSDAPPAELADALTGLRLGKPLVTVATIRTTRDRYRIIDQRRHRLLAEVDDDRVHASVDHRLLAWREVEVELGPDTSAVPRRLIERLADSGAHPSRQPSKLGRVSHVTRAQPDCSTAAASAVATYLMQQIDAIFDGDLGLRRGSDPIHDTRVAIRRLRSTLRVYRKLMDTTVGDIDDELKWFAGLLGDVRDCQVQRRHFRKELAQLPSELVLGPVANRISTGLQSEQLRARAGVTEAMNSGRYLSLLATLQHWRLDPPLAGPPSHKEVKKRARRAARKADRRLAAAVQTDDAARLHRARKAAKRARYAAELRLPIDKDDKGAKGTVKRYKRIQKTLGEHQDSVVASATLQHLAITAGTTPGENGFTYGLLYAREQHAAATAREQVRSLKS